MGGFWVVWGIEPEGGCGAGEAGGVVGGLGGVEPPETGG